jgi:hypothetical protein
VRCWALRHPDPWGPRQVPLLASISISPAHGASAPFKAGGRAAIRYSLLTLPGMAAVDLDYTRLPSDAQCSQCSAVQCSSGPSPVAVQGVAGPSPRCCADLREVDFLSFTRLDLPRAVGAASNCISIKFHLGSASPCDAENSDSRLPPPVWHKLRVALWCHARLGPPFASHTEATAVPHPKPAPPCLPMGAPARQAPISGRANGLTQTRARLFRVGGLEGLHGAAGCRGSIQSGPKLELDMFGEERHAEDRRNILA